jgi:P-type Cu2+ transporter
MIRDGRKRPAPRVVEATCLHCGLEVPPGLVRPDEEAQFCCSGCRQVHHILTECGADHYYRLLDRQDARGVPAAVSGRRFDELDDADLQAEQVETLTDGSRTTQLFLEGVHCAACVWLVEDLPRVVGGVVSVRLNLANSVVAIQWDPELVALSSIARALDSIGYTPHIRSQSNIADGRRAEGRKLLIKTGVAAVCAMNIMFIHGALYAGEHHGIAPRYEVFFRWVSFLLALPVVLYAATPFFRAAAAGLKHRVLHMDLPIAIALSTAFVFSAAATILGRGGSIYFDSLAALVALLLGARTIQHRAQVAALERAERIKGAAFVEFARRIAPSGVAVEVPIAALAPGQRVEVRSGELIPADGLVLDGRSSLDNAVLTGESDMVAVDRGDLVYAGATNLGARLVIEVRATGAESRVGALMALVDQAMSKKAQVVHLADRLSRYFVMAVLGLAVVAGLLAWMRSPDLGLAMEQVVALLVVTCPCALGLATPLALTVGLSRAANTGVFIKNPDAVELMKEINTVVLDKTGTLTLGAATVVEWEGSELGRELAYALELESVHPVAQAFCRSAYTPVRPVRQLEGVEEKAGLGIRGRMDETAVAVGNRSWMQRLGVTGLGSFDAVEGSLTSRGLSPVYVALDREVVGMGGIGDTIREDAARTVRALQQRGLELRILSGDHPEVVARVAQELGIDRDMAQGGLTPEEKCDVLAELKARPGLVLMVGDGVNDAAALALADVGVAVHGGAGASIAAADVVLTQPGLAPLLETIRGGHRLMGIVKRNLAFSLVYNAIGASLALLGLVGPLLAAVLMPVSSLTVILSSAVGKSFQRAGAARRPLAQDARE